MELEPHTLIPKLHSSIFKRRSNTVMLAVTVLMANLTEEMVACVSLQHVAVGVNVVTVALLIAEDMSAARALKLVTFEAKLETPVANSEMLRWLREMLEFSESMFCVKFAAVLMRAVANIADISC